MTSNFFFNFFSTKKKLKTLPSHCIRLLDFFNYRNHICMVFELLSMSLFDFLKSNHFKPFSLDHIQSFAFQLLTSVAFMHHLSLCHTDLKPENIMLVNPPKKSKQVSLFLKKVLGTLFVFCSPRT
jgi:serine/threonine protein kinase